MKTAKRKLTSLGTIQGCYSVVNSKYNMVRMEVDLQLAASCAEISAIKQAKMAKRNLVENELLLDEAPAAGLKLQKADCKCDNITVLEIFSLLGNIFGVTYPKSKQKKPTLVKRLEL